MKFRFLMCALVFFYFSPYTYSGSAPDNSQVRPVEIVNQPVEIVVTEGEITVEAGDSAIPVLIEGTTTTLPVEVQGSTLQRFPF